MDNIVGREQELRTLSDIIKSGESELVVIYGRRRVGKTFLIRNAFANEIAFELTGIHNASLKLQLENFRTAFASVSKQKGEFKNWMEAFKMLTQYLTPLIKRKRKVVFLDEFPWLSSARSGFMQAFEHFWNTWASRQKNLVVVICGSSAAWMIQRVINNKGGLHNRITRRMRLLPFSLHETELFLKSRNVKLDRYQVLQLYMAMGGVPQYLKEIKKGESATQIIDRVCFSNDGLLRNEFENLFLSLFDNATYHIDVIKAMAKKGMGMTRTEIIKACKLSSGGGATQILDELTESGFITPYVPFGKTSKDSIYKLTDEYSLFYIKFIESSRISGKGAWITFSNSASWRSWSGIAFEGICMKHTEQIKSALGIAGVHADVSVWRNTGSTANTGAQIDLLIDRQDQCINVCEIKFTLSKYDVTKAYAKELQEKLNVFMGKTQTKKTLFLTMITTFGVKNIANHASLIDAEITMDTLF